LGNVNERRVLFLRRAKHIKRGAYVEWLERFSTGASNNINHLRASVARLHWVDGKLERV
jgi:hypothetical protein